jgi:hypothetical protein
MNLKPIQIIAVALVFLFSAFAMTKPNQDTKQLQIKFVNISKDTIKNFVFSDKIIGNLNPSDTSQYYNFDSLTVNQNNRLIVNAKAFYRFADIDYYKESPQNSVKTIRNGKIIMDVRMYMSCGIGFDMVLNESTNQ